MFWSALGLILTGTVFLLIEVCLYPGKIMNAILGVGFLGWGMYLFLEHFPPWQGQLALLATLVVVSVVLIVALRIKTVWQMSKEESSN
ncbi:MAG: hypothetical protein A3G34_03270 [Candidatus Lindowbacteria bacterium RIFCSPLOWO2_12_FULL_62_27]|nr:MAG: hypothetical protein A3I06_16040 [Candidatus Lindowbacteria bacterium RIFCSPLOWO2_02_FULL_62_12]OGH62970.1 MAG: hypothetical protein A3G34_03270 [Candidatus Lindowbacteria bacterium RIFCSPLOWO2_12_FULL_62_27]